MQSETNKKIRCVLIELVLVLGPVLAATQSSANGGVPEGSEPKKCTSALNELTTGVLNPFTRANNLVELKEALFKNATMTVFDFIELAELNGNAGKFTDARLAKLLFTKQEKVHLATDEAIKRGLKGAGIVASRDEAVELLNKGSINLQSARFHILTDSQVGLSPSLELVGQDKVMLIFAPQILDNVQVVAVDRVTGGNFGRRSVLGKAAPTLNTIVNNNFRERGFSDFHMAMV